MPLFVRSWGFAEYGIYSRMELVGDDTFQKWALLWSLEVWHSGPVAYPDTQSPQLSGLGGSVSAGLGR
jgi:hypothetical protein